MLVIRQLVLIALAATVPVLGGCGEARPTPDDRGWPCDMGPGGSGLCNLGSLPPHVHPPGIADEASADFHGKVVRAAGYDFTSCKKCHGDDFAGGKAQKSCLTCHKQGVTACDTCHGNPPKTGAHLTHLEAGALAFAGKLECDACHVTPKNWDDPGHVFLVDGNGKRTLDPPPAEVVFGAQANLSVMPDHRGGPASWDRDSMSCANVYCHGATFDDSKAQARTPLWNGVVKGSCDGCHGNGPSSHASTRCIDCHEKVVDAAGKLIAPQKHIDGRISIGDESNTCWACHGRANAPEPPRVLAGSTGDPSLIVGAHAAHLAPRLGLRGPMACTDCHLVPKLLRSPGHIDDDLPAEVFPKGADFALGTLATANGAQPAWDRAKGTCANVYCHGGGARLSKDLALGTRRTPTWTGNVSDAQCGACHGAPPDTVIDAKGTRHPKQGACVQCHPNTVDERGQIILSGPPGMQTSRHMNGIVDTP